jgi:hypothetical protein
VPLHRKLIPDVPEPPCAWHYLPVAHHVQIGRRHHLTLTNHDGSVIHTTVATPEHATLLEPYLHLFNLEQLDPWTNGPAYLPVEQTDDSWQFSAAGAHFDGVAATDSETATPNRTNPYRRLAFQ